MTSKQQLKLQHYFQKVKTTDGSPVTGAGASQGLKAAHGHQIGSKRSAVDDSKENVPPSSASGMGFSKQPTGGSGSGKASSRASKQLFLDFGQKDFGASRCSVCGMVYAKGHEEDEKLHKSFHQGAVQGLKFQGWVGERVLLTDPFSGRLLMIMQSDPAAHVKRAREACSFIEKGYGITTGWLLSSPQCRVFLFVSLQKRIVGLAVVEPIKQAYKLAAADIDQEADSSQPQPQQALQQQQQTQQRPLLGRQQMHMQQQALQWPGLHRSSNSRPRLTEPSSTSWLPAASCGTAAVGAISNAAASDTAKADSCPASLLAAAQHMQMHSASAGLSLQRQGGLQQTSQGQQQQACSSVSDGSVCNELLHAAQQTDVGPADAEEGVSASRPAASQPRQQQQVEMPPPPAQPPAAMRSGAGAGRSCTSARSGAGASGGSCLLMGSGIGIGGSLAVGAAASGGCGGGSGGDNKSSKGVRSAGLSTAGGGSSSSSCLLADKTKAVRAMLGVRMVWVSAEQRRKGLATKLLDAARCNMIPGYVVPRNQMAFTQPTEEGYHLAAQFTGTQQFLVYGLE